MMMLPNGEWRSERVQFYGDMFIQNGLEHYDDIADFLVEGIMLALVSSAPKIYPRHRWTGFDLAIDDLGSIECVHRLFSSSFARMVASYSKGMLRTQLLHLAVHLRPNHSVG